MTRYYLIPARLGSKGVPKKNRLLFEATAETIPAELAPQVIMATDDGVLLQKAMDRGWHAIPRPAENTLDTSQPKEYMEFVIEAMHLEEDDEIVLLYLTYPDREWWHVEEVIRFYEEKNATSVLCAQPALTHPFKCIYPDGDYGKPVIVHEEHRRQDYPSVLEIVHFVGVFKVGAISALGPNLYNDETMYVPILRVRDVDNLEDLD